MAHLVELSCGPPGPIPSCPILAQDRVRMRIAIQGAVQGVGFRPFVYRLAGELGLSGWVSNGAQGVRIEVEGPGRMLEAFLLRVEQDKPPRAAIHSLESTVLDPVGYARFEIRPSADGGTKTALVLPDIATCPDCAREIFDSTDRRYRYPFTNCTNCGPRFSIILALPYDRIHTTMQRFAMCPDCRAEYEDPRNRRFHAQPNACPACGPHLELWDERGAVLASHDDALRAASEAIGRGRVVAVKGLGGFQLIVDARNGDAIARLRRRKHREEKPFALMFPSLAGARKHCEVSALEARLLGSPESPIVLLRRNAAPGIAPAVAPGNPYLGAMVPYTPLHHVLMAELGFPVVATSGNLSDEPMCTDEHEALKRLAGIADAFLVHDRPIARHVDDSITRVMLGRELVLRRARGYAPLPVHLQEPASSCWAVGAHLKNTVALARGHEVFVSQHIGDLETPQAFGAFQQTLVSLADLYDHRPSAIVCDRHPEYLSTMFARASGLPVVEVQHHYAHVLACMAENQVAAPCLGVAWDGTGYGLDGTIWGGESLRITDTSFERLASWRTFRLPGGEQAIKEPRRTAIGLLFEWLGADVLKQEDLAPVRSFSSRELRVVLTMLSKSLNAPRTSSVGRMFDAVAAIAGVRQRNRFEGQGAMELEFALEGIQTDEAYEIRLLPSAASFGSPVPASAPAWVVDWGFMMQAIVEDVRAGLPAGLISAKFHNALVEAVMQVAARSGEERVVLSGGCFQNRYLTERAVRRLAAAGFRPYWHQRIPPNDGGIALGQILAASRAVRGSSLGAVHAPHAKDGLQGR